MKILSIGDKVRVGNYRFHSRFRRAVNFTDGRRLVTLVTPDIGAGPVNIVVRDLTPFASFPKSSPGFSRDSGSASGSGSVPIDPSRSGVRFPPASEPVLRRAPRRGEREDVHVGRYSVVFANRRFLLNETQSYGSLLQLEKETRREVFRRNLRIVENILVKESHPKSLTFLLDTERELNFQTAFDRAFLAQIKDGASRMFSVAGVRRFAGCGFGLTPSGDDFIAGMLIGLSVLQRLTGRNNRRLVQTIYSAAKGKNLLSNSFLRLARDGRVTEPVQAFVSALSGHDDAKLEQNTRSVMAAGETSGADLLTGFVMTVKRY